MQDKMAMGENQVAVRVESQVGFVPRSLADFLAVGDLLVKSGLAPHGVDTKEKAAIIMLKGMELGLKALESFGDLYVVNGQAAMGTKLMVSLYEQAGHRFELDEWTADVVRGRFILRDGHVFEHVLTMQDVRDAKWNMMTPKGGGAMVEKATWKQMPKTMLLYRWQATGIRAFAPGALHQMLSRDEAEDPRVVNVDPSTGEVIDGESSELEELEVRSENDAETAPAQVVPGAWSAWVATACEQFGLRVDQVVEALGFDGNWPSLVDPKDTKAISKMARAGIERWIAKQSAEAEPA